VGDIWQLLKDFDEWLASKPIPIGQWAKSLVQLMTEKLEWFFDGITQILKTPIEGTASVLKEMPMVLVIIPLIALLAHRLHRNWLLTGFVVLGLAFIVNQGLREETIETLVLVLSSTFVSLAIGVPIGIVCARRPWLYRALSPVLDMMQTIPTFVYLVPTLIFFGLGMVPGLIATVVFVVPAPIRMTYLGISQVNQALVEAGESFGCTRWQLLTKVKLPAALPTIMAGVNQTIMLSLSMVVIAALVGADGLGKPVIRALAQANVPLGVVSGLAIVVMAIVLDRIMRQPQRARAIKQMKDRRSEAEQ
jgi:glycine betaine/proline transport system permease protein